MDFLDAIASHNEPIPIGITPSQLFILIAQLQVAQRHPGNTGDSAIAALEMGKRLAEILYQVVPEARATIEQGWDQSYDITRDYFEAEFDDEEF